MAHRSIDTGRESGRTLVLFVSDPSDPEHGEISVLDTTEEAERKIETLLEAGFEQERILVFTGAQVDFEISYRPVATFASDASDQVAHPDRHVGNGSEPEAAVVASGGTPSLAEAHSDNGRTGPKTQLSNVFRSDSYDIRDRAGLRSVEAYRSESCRRSQARFSSPFRSVRDEPSYRSALQEIA